MNNSRTRSSFTPEHHALLFGWIAREVIRRFGEEKGEEVLRKAVRRYGEQRGKRMALRARADGHQLSTLNYFAYVEWEAEKGEMEYKLVKRNPDLHAQFLRCSWVTAWEKNGLSQYTGCYCPTADEGIMRGYNPDLKLDILANRANGAPSCDMVFHEAHLSPRRMILLKLRSMRVKKRAIMPWEYHTGHLYKTMHEVIVSNLGEEGKGSLRSALRLFSQRYGEESAAVVTAYDDCDFDRLPEERKA